jgi:hypothetical protein
MTDEGPWLNIPQAVVLEVTRDIEVVAGLTADNVTLLVIKANQLLPPRIEIPLEANADSDQWFDALSKFEEAKPAMLADSRYLEGQQRVRRRLLEGVRTKFKRTPDGPYENVDRVEYIGTELQGVNAIDINTRRVKGFDVLISAYNYIERMTGKPLRPADAAPSSAPGQAQEQSSRERDKWECTGDPVPKLIDWARSEWGADLRQLPNRFELLRLFREQFGQVLGINEKTMRIVCIS